MIVYSETKAQFVDDVSQNVIHTRILDAFDRVLGRRVGNNEIASWRNSMQFMANAVRDPDIPDEAGVAIEFTVPLTSKRVDFILSGQDESEKDVAVIVELKQWSSVSVTEKDAIVMTALGGGVRETTHPSYQAWTYATLIRDFNETVRDEDIGLKPCAYLHNLDQDDAIRDPHYAEHLEKAPCFISRDAAQITEFLKSYIKHPDHGQIMYRIEHGRIRPSKALADCLVGMLNGNPEFLMVDEQKLAYEAAIESSSDAQSGKRQVLIVRGGPGTGKSVVAVNLLVEFTRQALVTQYVSRNAAPRAVYAAKLQGHMRKSHINQLFKGSGTYTESNDRDFDVLLIDEAHRLNEKSGLYSNLGENQVKELIRASKLSVFFLDEDQRVTLKDIGTEQEIRRWANELGAETRAVDLASQFRCNGSESYMAFVDSVMQIRETAHPTISQDDYDFRVYDNPYAMHEDIRQLNDEANKARMVAGYCWDWRSRNDAQAQDIEFEEYGYQAQWNLIKDGSLWIVADRSVEEVGCIHTCQGLEIDYVGVIFGEDFLIRDGRAVIDATKRSRMDSSVRGIITMLREEPDKAAEMADRIVKNTYRTLMTRGQKGCFVFSADEETREYFSGRISETTNAH